MRITVMTIMKTIAVEIERERRKEMQTIMSITKIDHADVQQLMHVLNCQIDIYEWSWRHCQCRIRRSIVTNTNTNKDKNKNITKDDNNNDNDYDNDDMDVLHYVPISMYSYVDICIVCV